MSEKPEKIQGGPDLSDFEAEFEGENHFVALRNEFAEAAFAVAEAQRNVVDTDRAQAKYDDAMTEADQPYKSPLAQLHHLHDAYEAAHQLKRRGELASDEVLRNLEVRMTAVQFLIQGGSSNEGFGGET
jgi:hypothetical protein